MNFGKLLVILTILTIFAYTSFKFYGIGLVNNTKATKILANIDKIYKSTTMYKMSFLSYPSNMKELIDKKYLTLKGCSIANATAVKKGYIDSSGNIQVSGNMQNGIYCNLGIYEDIETNDGHLYLNLASKTNYTKIFKKIDVSLDDGNENTGRCRIDTSTFSDGYYHLVCELK